MALQLTDAQFMSLQDTLGGGLFSLARRIGRGISSAVPAASAGVSGVSRVMSGEIARARLDQAERMKRVKVNRPISRLTLPKIFGDGEAKSNILADVL